MKTALALVLAGFSLGVLGCNAVLGIDEASFDPKFRKNESCVLNSDCAKKGQVCIFRVCSPPCAHDIDCSGSRECLRTDNGTACVDPKDRMCKTTAADCPAGTTCSMGSCQTVCTSDHDCTADQSCEQTHCLPRNLDAGTRDAGNDAGKLEAVSAAAESDAGNAGTVDAGDAGRPLITSSHGDAGDAGGAVCQEGAVRCEGSAQGLRSKCEHGAWTADAPCPTGQLCDSTSSPAGQCANVLPECVGASPGVLSCNGAQGTVCGPDLVTAKNMACKSAQHCALGHDGVCALCITGEHSCDNNELARCNDTHDGFDMIEHCTTTAPCNAAAGACTALACLPSNKRCNGDALETCNADQSGWDHLSSCAAGLCDAINFECDVCNPGNSCKDGSTRVMCSSDGQTRSESVCPGATPYCTGAGTCAECTQAGNCTAPNDCHTATCNVGTGQCEVSARGLNAQCAGGYCDANAQCVACTLDQHCSASTECFAASCNGGTCGEMAKGSSTPCSNGRVCDGAGSCVACVTPAQCSASSECFTATCNSHQCGQSANGRGSLCASGTRFCDGSGACVQCVMNSQCASTEVCRGDACVNAVHTIGGENATSTTASATKDWLYLRRLPALTHAAELQNFGVIGTGSGASVKMVLYADNGSGTAPSGAPLDQTPNAIGLMDTARLGAPAVANLALSAGTIYWLGFMANATTTLKAQALSSQVGVELPNGYSNPFPTNPASTASNGVLEAVYITVRDVD